MRRACRNRLAGDGATGDVLLNRLEHLIDHYDRYNTRAPLAYRWLKLLQLAFAALVPISVGLDLPKLATALLGGEIVVVEGRSSSGSSRSDGSGTG
jgi:hypothetical protein